MTGYPICPHALTIICSNALKDCSYDLTHCSYDLTVDSKQLTVSPSNDKYRPSGKSIAILGAILSRSLASPGINFSALINNNFFMSNKYLDCRLDCR